MPIKIRPVKSTYSCDSIKAKLLLEACHFTYLPEVDIQVQNGQEALGSLVSSILDMGLAC